MTIIQEIINLDNPKARRELGLSLLTQGASIAEVRKHTGASENTVKSWRRRARKASESTFPQAVVIPLPVDSEAAETTETGFRPCPEGCGLQVDLSWSDEKILRHWAWQCPTASSVMKHDAWRKLEELRKAECKSESTSQNVNSSNSVDTSQDMMIPGLPNTMDMIDTAGRISVESITPLSESSPAPDSLDDSPNNSTDWFYQWKFDGNGNVREGWSYTNLLEWYWRDVKPFGTKGCHSVTHR